MTEAWPKPVRGEPDEETFQSLVKYQGSSRSWRGSGPHTNFTTVTTAARFADNGIGLFGPRGLRVRGKFQPIFGAVPTVEW